MSTTRINTQKSMAPLSTLVFREQCYTWQFNQGTSIMCLYPHWSSENRVTHDNSIKAHVSCASINTGLQETALHVTVQSIQTQTTQPGQQLDRLSIHTICDFTSVPTWQTFLTHNKQLQNCQFHTNHCVLNLGHNNKRLIPKIWFGKDVKPNDPCQWHSLVFSHVTTLLAKAFEKGTRMMLLLLSLCKPWLHCNNNANEEIRKARLQLSQHV